MDGWMDGWREGGRQAGRQAGREGGRQEVPQPDDASAASTSSSTVSPCLPTFRVPMGVPRVNPCATPPVRDHGQIRAPARCCPETGRGRGLVAGSAIRCASLLGIEMIKMAAAACGERKRDM